MTKQSVQAVYPCGECYCGCGAALDDPRAFFLTGHDKRAEAEVIREKYGSVVAFVVAHGYGPKSRRGPKPKLALPPAHARMRGGK